MPKRKIDIIKAEELVNELYSLFTKLGVTRPEFSQWLNKILTDRHKTESCLIDLFFCFFIKEGLSKKHLRALSLLLRHKEFRNIHLCERLDYLLINIVRPSDCKSDG